jgi:sigma-B regulation protein RsbU (phosphoserine phosphatase)
MTGSPPLPGVDELYDAAPCGLLVAGGGGQLLHANATICRWLQYDRSELLEKQKLQDLMSAGGRIFFHTHLQPLLRMQGSVSEVKLEIRRKDGKSLPMILNISEQAWQGTMLWQVAAFIAEDRHQYERELLAQRQRAEELSQQHARDQQELNAARAQAEDRALFAEQLVGMVSHDIRNPLSVIQMSAVLLERGVPPEQQKAVVARIARSVGRVQHLVGDLLDFTQARLGHGLRVNIIRADLHRALADTVLELDVAFPGRLIRHVQIGAGACQADPDRIAQAVGNLVANAVKYGAPDRPITVRSETTGASFRIEVHNEGPPIPSQLLPRVFEPMVHGVPSELAGRTRSLGLGLYIVREIVRSHGGQVEVASTAQEGTTFSIELPQRPV